MLVTRRSSPVAAPIVYSPHALADALCCIALHCLLYHCTQLVVPFAGTPSAGTAERCHSHAAWLMVFRSPITCMADGFRCPLTVALALNLLTVQVH